MSEGRERVSEGREGMGRYMYAMKGCVYVYMHDFLINSYRKLFEKVIYYKRVYTIY